MYDEEKEYQYLVEKRERVLKEISPICNVFGIKDYDYIILKTGQREILRLNSTKIGCSMNSIDAIKNELIGYIFLTTWCHDRRLGAFETQTKNVIKRYWIE